MAFARLAKKKCLVMIIHTGIFVAVKQEKVDMGSNTQEVVMMEPDTTYSPLFWDEEGVAIGDYDSFFIGDDEYSTSTIEGLKEWFMQADKYDPYTDIAHFTTEGMEEWINLGYEYAKQIRAMIPKDVKLYYGFWHQFGDGKWSWCKTYIAY